MSPVPETLSGDAAGDVGLDYVALVAEGTALVQKLSGLTWTNYNYSDPGVTILEQLCYALTELSYRADFLVQDLLGTPGTGRVELRRQGLYPARSIMPVNPVTTNDLRRLIVDRVRDAGNAWFTPVRPGEACGLSGLYRIDVLIPGLDPGCDDHGPDPQVVREQVLAVYAGHRALCEDVEACVVLRPLGASVQAVVQLDGGSDPDRVLADLLFRLGLALSPEPKRSSLDEQRATGRTTAEIFNGPLMLRGFIADDQLSPMPSLVPVEHLLEVMAGTPGVVSVDGDHMSVHVANDPHAYVPGDTIEVPDGFLLRLVTLPGAEGSAIRLMHGSTLCRPNPVRVARLLDRAWADQRRTYRLGAEYAEQYAPPAGMGADLAAYSSIQDQFPEVYGIGTYGLPPQAGAVRLAQAKQLKGYLMVFDQLMADFFAQLAFVRDLFSIGAGGDKTYASQSLRGIVPNVEPLLERDYEAGLLRLVAASDPVVARQTAILDFLLSLYDERLRPPAGSACGGPGDGIPGTAQLKAKQALLARMVPATRDRGRGFDYRLPSPRDSVGIEIRPRIELALLDATGGRDGVQATAEPGAASFGHLLPEALGAVIARTFLPVETAERETENEREEGPSPLAGERVAAALLPALGDPTRYRVGALPGKGPVYLVCEDMEGAWWALGEHDDVAEAVAATDRLVRAADQRRRQLFIIEWTLLRYALEHRCDEPDEDYPPGFFSFRISAVLPVGEDEEDCDDREDGGWRGEARKILRADMPAHVLVEELFLGHGRMRLFHRLYEAWTEALRHGSPRQKARTSWDLARFLRGGRPVPPCPPAPPPCPPPPGPPPPPPCPPPPGPPPPPPCPPPPPPCPPPPCPPPPPPCPPPPCPPPPPPPPSPPVLPGTVQAAASGALGFDCDTKLTTDSARAFAAAGFRFAIRYLTRDAPEAECDLTTEEALEILGAGLALMAVQHVAPAGWVPSAGLGAEQGGYAAANAMQIGLPPGVSVWLDLEGVAAGTPACDVTAYCNAWYAPVAEAGYVPGVYVGSGDILDGEELFEDLLFELFWQSGSDVPDVAVYGYCLVQTIGGDVLDGVAYDSDIVQPDNLGALPFWLEPTPASIRSFTIAPDPVVPGSPVTFTLSWEVDDGASFQILADDGPDGSTYALPVPAVGSGSYVVMPRRLEVTYTLQLLTGQ